MAYDHVINELGDFGRYQRRIYILLCLPAISCAFHKLAWVFLGAKADHRCQLPFEDSNASYSLQPDVWNMSIPWDSHSGTFSSCYRYDANFSEEYFQQSQPAAETVPCTSWIFDHSKYESSAIIEWNLVCNSAWLRATADSLFMIGVLLGSIIFGDLSDRFGRRPLFFASLVLQLVGGILASVAPEYFSFVLARMLVGATTSGVFLVAYVIALEMVGAKKRLIAGVVCQMFFSLGYMLTALLAYMITDWRHLQIALTLPGVAFMCYWWIIPESARWLLTKNRKDEAVNILLLVAKENKVNISAERIQELLALDNDDSPSSDDKEKEMTNLTPLVKNGQIQNGGDHNIGDEEEPQQEKMLPNGSAATVKKSEQVSSPSVLDLFRYPNLRKKSLNIFYCWFVNSATYYGLSWNTSNLGGNDYINFLISGVVEIPGYVTLLLLLNRWGRKATLCFALLIAGVALLLTQVVPSNTDWLVISLAMLGKMAITASYGTVYIFTAEQFPTVIRNVGLGAASTSARVGGVLAPYLNLLADYWRPIPLLIFGSLSLTAGSLALLLPETLNKKLPETIEDGEQFGKNLKKVSSLNRLSSVKTNDT